MTRISTGCCALDALLGGGLESSAITLLYGEGGSGKTNICLQATFVVLGQGHKVIYIDTEGVSMERFEQICGGNKEFRKASRETLFFQPTSDVQLREALKNTHKLVQKDLHIGLVVLDSATVFYRMMGSGRNEDSRRDISQIIVDLMEISRKQDIPVLVTTQVYSASESSDVRPIGGHALSHNCKTIIKLERIGDGGLRRAVLMKHRSMPTGRSVGFHLTGCGVEDVADEEMVHMPGIRIKETMDRSY
ncbi:MAG: DNA repair and recombination protein RadB [Candidatus Thermoplasmatota archaeon]|nr:DNA repair and recombination protein RadB [Candidatus Thermoplasmatota archaeon]